MKTLIRIAVAAAMMAWLAGCASFGPREAQRYYVLDVPAAKADAAASPRSATLLIAPAAASGFYQTEEIVYSRAPGLRAYYQLHAWTERPGVRITELLTRRLERAGSFRSVTTTLSGVQGSVVLSTQLNEFFHDAATAPGTARISMTAELTDPVRRVLLARRTFEQSAPAPGYDAPGAVQAFGVAVAAMLDDIAVWVEDSAPR